MSLIEQLDVAMGSQGPGCIEPSDVGGSQEALPMSPE